MGTESPLRPVSSQQLILSPLFTQVRGRRILGSRTSPFRVSKKFDRARYLGLHPLDPPHPPLGRLERLGEIPPIVPHPAVLKLEDQHHVGHPPAAVIRDPLGDPKPLP